ncbi:MAG TPA: hypothetical protein GX497_00140 [Bacillus bacterium]|nr:hypothetical protein [Bacillus sp. (in: firmicutes)]
MKLNESAVCYRKSDYLGADSVDKLASSTELGKLIVKYKETVDGAIFPTLDTEVGIEVHSRHNVLFQAEKDFELTGGQALQIKAGESIHVTCNTSNIVMDGITDIQGDLVKMEGCRYKCSWQCSS